jgi:Concanavalin A-like lectin/glucanases superfamily/Domain of unknown function (DUF2341)/Putative peptidoglycan binding domain
MKQYRSGIAFIILALAISSVACARAATSAFDFGSGSSYSYDGTKVEFSGSQAQLKATSTPVWYGADWTYRKKITIDHTKISGSLTDFPVLISRTDTDWKDTVNGGYVGQSDGGDFVFTSSDGVTALHYEIEQYVSSTGVLAAWVRVPAVSSSTDTDLYAYYGNASVADQQTPTQVWDNNFKMVQHINASGSTLTDSTSNGANGALIFSRFANTTTSPDVISHQGVARDSTNYYTFDTNAIRKFDTNWSLVSSSSNPIATVGGFTDHLGDGDYYSNKLYIPVEHWGGTCADFSHQYITVWNSSDLSFVTKYDVSAQAHEVAGISVDPTAGTHGIIYVVSYCDGSKIWKYDLADGSFVGSISLSQDISQMQGITYKDGYFYISDDLNDSVWKVAFDGTVLNTVVVMHISGSFEGVDYSGDHLLTLLDQGAGNQKVHSWDPAVTDVSRTTNMASALDFDGAEYAQVPLVLPNDGSISIWYYPKSPFYNFNAIFDNSGGGNDWEMWVYGDGRLAARAAAGGAIVQYDLDNISGPDHWYDITFTWQKTGNKTLYVNGVSRNSNTTTWQDPGSTFYIGGGNPANASGKGYIDEVRISDTVRSADWIATSFANQNAPSTFDSASSQVVPYDTSNPTVQPGSAIPFRSISGFSETATKNGGEIGYQLSNDGGTTWYWYSGGWVTTSSGYAESNTASQVDANSSSFPMGSGQFLFRAYLHSDGTQLVQLDGVTLTYDDGSGSHSVTVSGGGASGGGRGTVESASTPPVSSAPVASSQSTTPSSVTGLGSSQPVVFHSNLSYRTITPEVIELQRYLNAHGFVVSKAGAGSPGHETSYFGLLTSAALIKFQEAHAKEILTPNGLTRGTGYFGPSTRAFMAK